MDKAVNIKKTNKELNAAANKAIDTDKQQNIIANK